MDSGPRLRPVAESGRALVGSSRRPTPELAARIGEARREVHQPPNPRPPDPLLRAGRKRDRSACAPRAWARRFVERLLQDSLPARSKVLAGLRHRSSRPRLFSSRAAPDDASPELRGARRFLRAGGWSARIRDRQLPRGWSLPGARQRKTETGAYSGSVGPRRRAVGRGATGGDFRRAPSPELGSGEGADPPVVPSSAARFAGVRVADARNVRHADRPRAPRWPGRERIPLPRDTAARHRSHAASVGKERKASSLRSGRVLPPASAPGGEDRNR